MKQTVHIQEGIWDIKSKRPIKEALFTFNGQAITRQLYNINRSNSWNAKTDVIDSVRVSLKDLSSKSIEEIIGSLKKKALDCFSRNVQAEIPFFQCPIITHKHTQ